MTLEMHREKLGRTSSHFLIPPLSTYIYKPSVPRLHLDFVQLMLCLPVRLRVLENKSRCRHP